jgi:hypothetical protein
MKTRILHLSLKEKWFCMIVSGEKKEEYREMNDYWKKRLVESEGNLIEPDITFKRYDVIEFTWGYPKADDTEKRKQFVCNGIEIKEGKTSWGAEPGKRYYVIKIGEIIS